MNKIERKRLEKLIGFLKNLNRKKFYFNNVVDTWDEKGECGSICCAIGWTPVIFPRSIKWVPGSHDLFVKKINKQDRFDRVSYHLFGIHPDLSFDLFRARNQYQVNKNLNNLPNKATPKAVAKMLEKFLKLVDKGEIKL